MDAEYQKGAAQLLDAAGCGKTKKNLGVFTYNIRLYSVHCCVFLKSQQQKLLSVGIRLDQSCVWPPSVRLLSQHQESFLMDQIPAGPSGGCLMGSRSTESEWVNDLFIIASELDWFILWKCHRLGSYTVKMWCISVFFLGCAYI